MQRVLPMMCSNAAGSFSWCKRYITHLWSKVRLLSSAGDVSVATINACFGLQHVVTPHLMARQLQPEMQMTHKVLEALQALFIMKDPGTREEYVLMHGYK
jgi:hypothetical protein